MVDLEEHASNRANFERMDEANREEVERWLAVANATKDDESLRDVKENYMYACGAAGMKMKEAKTIWWNYVHDGPAPIERENLV